MSWEERGAQGVGKEEGRIRRVGREGMVLGRRGVWCFVGGEAGFRNKKREIAGRRGREGSVSGEGRGGAGRRRGW